MKNGLIALSILLCLCTELSAQESNDWIRKDLESSFYVTWGYNRSFYRPSDIHFKGQGFDFTLYDVEADDDPEEFQAKVYLNPLKFTIPQFNFRLGYYLKDNLSVSIGWDHMKYVVTVPQQVQIEGYIDPAISQTYGSQYNNEPIELVEDFLRYEHTDGLNYVRLGIEKHGNLIDIPSIHTRLDMFVSGSAGLMTPWTDFRFLDVRYRNKPHLSGWAVSGLLGGRLRYKNTFFVQWQIQQGYIRMGDILLQDHLDSRAKQEIWFNETSISLGANLPLYWRRGKNKDN